MRADQTVRQQERVAGMAIKWLLAGKELHISCRRPCHAGALLPPCAASRLVGRLPTAPSTRVSAHLTRAVHRVGVCRDRYMQRAGC